MWEQGASQEETASLEEVAGCQWEEEGMEVSVGEEARLVVACLLVAGWVACWGQRVGVKKGVVVGVPSSSQKEVAEALGVVVDLVSLGSG